jgi:transposase
MEKEQVRMLWESMKMHLNEKQRRQYAATLAKTYGYGGATVVHEMTGISMNTITAGKKDIKRESGIEDVRIRQQGGGAKNKEDKYPGIQECVKEIVDGNTYGSPEKILSWTTKSLRSIQKTLSEKYGIKASYVTVGVILEKLGYSKQANQKMLQVGEPHPDRNEQFEIINGMAKIFILDGQPVISVDTKKKENVGNFKNNGREYRKSKNPRKVLDHDFPLKELGKVAPYGVYVLNDNTAYVNLGTSHDTSEFAVESINRWWEMVGKNTFKEARKLYINCDSGGSNGNRVRLWKYQLQQLANRTRLEIYVSHFPPGTSKWNKIEHRLFCYISKNWAGKPLVDVETIVNLISSTITDTGLSVICERDDNIYPLAQKVSDDDFEAINIRKMMPFKEWNYIIYPV